MIHTWNLQSFYLLNLFITQIYIILHQDDDTQLINLSVFFFENYFLKGKRYPIKLPLEGFFDPLHYFSSQGLIQNLSSFTSTTSRSLKMVFDAYIFCSRGYRQCF